VMDLPAIVADAWSAGLWAERRPTTPVSAIKNLLTILIKRYYRGCSAWASGGTGSITPVRRNCKQNL